jgi:adenine-specific DNA-methyltransferase
LRFIGSKAKLLSTIENAIRKYYGSEPTTFADLFCGTAVVSRHFKRLGYEVTANDNLVFCSELAKAVLLVNEEPQFPKLVDSGLITLDKEIEGLSPKPYDFVLDYLNRLPGIKGFIYEEYSPEGTLGKNYVRRYFTEFNAQKIDAIRQKIADLSSLGFLSEAEESLLIADLIKATNKVANIAGTYGYFLKDWDRRAYNSLTLTRSRIIKSNKQHKVYNSDANNLVSHINCRLLYLDPPYTWRHYGAYYHILETIARWDKPKVVGMSGIRPWEDSKSRYCYREDAADALAELIGKAKAEHIFLSYNDEGLITHDTILKILSTRGEPSLQTISYRRYQSHNENNTRSKVMERIYYVRTEK